MRSFPKSDGFFKGDFDKRFAKAQRSFAVFKGFIVLLFVAGAIATVWFMTAGQTFGFEESRVYACPYCGGWHITSQVKEAHDAWVDRLLADYEKLGK